MLTAVQAFHTTRRMFCVIDGALKIGMEGDTSSHMEWFLREGWVRSVNDHRFQEITRGFVDDRGLFVYKGHDFSPVGLMHDLSLVWADLISTFHLGADRRVWFGVKPARHGDAWEGRRAIGTVADLVAKVDRYINPEP